LVIVGEPASIDRLIDRAVDPPPAGADPQDIYGDVFLRSDLSEIRDSQGPRTAADALLRQLAQVTARANVWDSVALSIEGKPQAGASVADLAGMARGAIALIREQVDQDDVELAALAELAKVNQAKDALQIDLALPVADLFDKLRFPCPGKDQPKQPRRMPGPNVPAR